MIPVRIYLLFIFVVSCSSLPCYEDDNGELIELSLENRGYKWNCGTLYWNADKANVEELCALFADMQLISSVSVRQNHWYVDIEMTYFYDRDTSQSTIYLIHTKKNGYVIKDGSRMFKSDALASYIIGKLGITNTNPNKCP